MNTAEQQRQQLIEDIQALPAGVLPEVTELVNQLHQKTAVSETKQSSDSEQLTPYEVVVGSGFIDCGEDPFDLAANHKQYLAEGWGQKYRQPSSLQNIARLPIDERHQLLEKHVAKMAEDFANEPALTEFSEIDMDDWSADNVGA